MVPYKRAQMVPYTWAQLVPHTWAQLVPHTWAQIVPCTGHKWPRAATDLSNHETTVKHRMYQKYKSMNVKSGLNIGRKKRLLQRNLHWAPCADNASQLLLEQKT